MKTQYAAQTGIPGTGEQQQVEAALNAHAMRSHLQGHAGGVDAAYGSNGHSLNTHVLDAKYEPGARCTVLYEVGERLLIGELEWAGAPEAPAAMHLHAYEDDPALPGLRTVLDGEAMGDILGEVLPECTAGAARIVRCRVTPLRYRLGKRCTLRFDLHLREQGTGAFATRTLYGKLYHSAAKAQAVCSEMQMLAASPALSAAGVKVASVAAFVPQLPMLLQGPVGGVPLDLLLCAAGRSPLHTHDERAQAGIRGAAAALAALHGGGMVTNRTRPVADELARMQQRSERILRVAPAAGAALHGLACTLPAWLPCLPGWGEEITLVHGDCKPSQFFVLPGAQGSRRRRSCGAGFRPLRHGGPGGRRRQLSSLAAAGRGFCPGPFFFFFFFFFEEAFLAAYMAASGSPGGFALRAAWYEAVALLRKGLRSFRAAHARRCPRSWCGRRGAAWRRCPREDEFGAGAADGCGGPQIDRNSRAICEKTPV